MYKTEIIAFRKTVSQETEPEQTAETESIQSSEPEDTQTETDTDEKKEVADVESETDSGDGESSPESETETPVTEHSSGGSEPAAQGEQVYTVDLENLEELTAETNMLIAEHNEVLSDIHTGILVLAALLGMLLGMFAVNIFGVAMNHNHK